MELPRKQWQALGIESEPILIKQFSEGENHHTCLIKSGADTWVIKKFEHSFDQAVEGQKHAAALGIAPAIKRAESPLLLMGYIDAQPLANPHNQDLDRLAACLAKLHAAPYSGSRVFDLVGFSEHYANQVGSWEQNKHRELSGALDWFCQDQTPTTFCHNDLVLQNIIIKNEQTFFIDWEFAAINNPWFDLAAVIVYASLDKDQAKRFLTAYQPTWGELVNKPIFLSAQITLLWLDLLWHCAREPNYRSLHQPRFDHLEKLASEFNRLTTA